MTVNRKKTTSVSPLSKPSRSIPHKTSLFLYVHAAGRCEFDNCNNYLLEHHVTGAPGNFAERAHIWAFSEAGPRGGSPDDFDVHGIENLMLLCPRCHKLVDEHPEEYTVEVLRKFKHAHESRVFELTDTQPDRVTVAIRMRGRIAGEPVSITLPEIQAAVAPRFIGKRSEHEIDLTGFEDVGTPEFWRLAAGEIRRRMRSFYETQFD